MDGKGKKPLVSNPKPRIRALWQKADKSSPASAAPSPSLGSSSSQTAKPISEPQDHHQHSPRAPLPNSQTDKKPAVSSPQQPPSVRSVWVVKGAPESTDEARSTASGERLTETDSVVDLLECVESDGSSSFDGKKKKKKKSKLPVFSIPEDVKREIEMDKVPQILREPLSLTNYSDYFSVLLYAEDFYIEKWNNFMMYNVTLEMGGKEAKERKNKNADVSFQKDSKMLLSFKITSIPERRPYLLSRDYVFLRRSGKKKSTLFEGRLVRVKKSTHVLVEFGDDLYSQHSPSHKYDVSFSFNRTCLKRCHQAVRAALDPSFQSMLFPSRLPRATAVSQPMSATYSSDQDQASVIQNILSLRGPPPYVISGRPILAQEQNPPNLTNVGATILEAICQIYAQVAGCRILVCAPANRICDVLISGLQRRLPADSKLFRANAAFREIEDVPGDVLPLCSYDGECFAEPPLLDLKSFEIIASTFMTCFRLASSGIGAGHFTHVFALDASSATEPEAMVALANFVREGTAVVVTGSLGKLPERVRSDMARRNGLKRSYLQRLVNSEPYSSKDPSCVFHLKKAEKGKEHGDVRNTI